MINCQIQNYDLFCLRQIDTIFNKALEIYLNQQSYERNAPPTLSLHNRLHTAMNPSMIFFCLTIHFLYTILITAPSILDDEHNLTTYKISPSIHGNILYKGTFVNDAALHFGKAVLF